MPRPASRRTSGTRGSPHTRSPAGRRCRRLARGTRPCRADGFATPGARACGSGRTYGIATRGSLAGATGCVRGIAVSRACASSAGRARGSGSAIVRAVTRRAIRAVACGADQARVRWRVQAITSRGSRAITCGAGRAVPRRAGGVYPAGRAGCCMRSGWGPDRRPIRPRRRRLQGRGGIRDRF